MQMSWTRLPFHARTNAEFQQGLTTWLGTVFYDLLPAAGFEVREEQVFTTFRIAKALSEGRTLFAEAGSGTGKSFAYLLPALCMARFTGRPVLIATASGHLQAQLTAPGGDIERLSRILDLGIDARLAVDPTAYLCPIKGDRLPIDRPKGWKKLHNWTKRTVTGARSEVPDLPDEVWAMAGWDGSLPCDTCRQRATCQPMKARRLYRGAADLLVTDHRLFAQDVLTREEREAMRQLPLLPPYAAVIVDEGHQLAETWQRAQGHQMSAARLSKTLALVGAYARQTKGALAEARAAKRRVLAEKLVGGAKASAQAFIEAALAAAAPGEGRRALPREGAVVAAAGELVRAIEALQDDLSFEESMVEGTAQEVHLRAYSARLDEMLAALALFGSPDGVPWVEGEDLWVVPRRPAPLEPGVPVLFTSATLESGYAAGLLGLERYEATAVGVPFQLAEQVLVYQPGSAAAGAGSGPAGSATAGPAPASAEPSATEVAEVRALIEAMRGRCLVLLPSLAAVNAYRSHLVGLDYRVLYEGDAERGAMIAAFRADIPSVLVGSSLWEGVDVPGESLSCVIIPRLPWAAPDPLILERRAQAGARGADPFLAVDLPEMLVKLKQGAGRLIRLTADRGVLALLETAYRDQPWAGRVEAVLPADADRTDQLTRVATFCP